MLSESDLVAMALQIPNNTSFNAFTHATTTTTTEPAAPAPRSSLTPPNLSTRDRELSMSSFDEVPSASSDRPNRSSASTAEPITNRAITTSVSTFDRTKRVMELEEAYKELQERFEITSTAQQGVLAELKKVREKCMMLAQQQRLAQSEMERAKEDLEREEREWEGYMTQRRRFQPWLAVREHGGKPVVGSKEHGGGGGDERTAEGACWERRAGRTERRKFEAPWRVSVPSTAGGCREATTDGIPDDDTTGVEASMDARKPIERAERSALTPASRSYKLPSSPSAACRRFDLDFNSDAEGAEARAAWEAFVKNTVKKKGEAARTIVRERRLQQMQEQPQKKRYAPRLTEDMKARLRGLLEESSEGNGACPVTEDMIITNTENTAVEVGFFWDLEGEKEAVDIT